MFGWIKAFGNSTGASPSDLGKDKERSHTFCDSYFRVLGFLTGLLISCLKWILHYGLVIVPSQKYSQVSLCQVLSRRNFPKAQPKPPLEWLEFPLVLSLVPWEQIPNPSWLQHPISIFPKCFPHA